MAQLIVAEEIRKYLVAQGLVTNAEAGTTNPPPCVCDPRDGALNVPVPSGATSVVTILTGQEIVNEWLEARFLQDYPIEIITRAKSRPTAELLQRTIAGKMLEKENILMGGLLIERSSQFRGIQAIAQDKDSWALSQSFRVSFRRASLTV